MRINKGQILYEILTWALVGCGVFIGYLIWG